MAISSAAALSVSTPTVNLLIKALEWAGILTEFSGQLRDRVYSFERY